MILKKFFWIFCVIIFCNISSFSEINNLNIDTLNQLENQLEKRGIFDTSIDLNVRITVPQQDGSEPLDLWATIFRPGGDKELPTIVIVTPYRREFLVGLYLPLLTHNYNILSIDIRGTGSTGGDWTSFGLKEHYDVKYLIDEWIPEQPWSDGKVGMIGPSYMGIMQYLVAGIIDRDENGEPEHLKALFPLATLSDTYKDILMHGGNVDLEFVPFWLGLVEVFGSIPPLLYLGEGEFPDFQTIKEATDIWKNHFDTITKTLGWVMNPANEFDGKYFKEKSPMIYWPIKPAEGWGFPEADNGVIPKKLPVFAIGGWFDLFPRGTINNYQYGLSEHEVSDKALVIGEMYHADMALGIGLKSIFTNKLAARWFDWKIKGKKDPFMEKFPVCLYVMGEDKWRAEKNWPLPESRVDKKTFYLSKHNPSPIDGDWYTDEPFYRWPFYLYDDNNYGLVENYSDIKFRGQNPEIIHEIFTPKGKFALHGGKSRSATKWSMGFGASMSQFSKHIIGKNIDASQKFEDEREDEKDCLTFTTEPLREDFEIVGPLTLTFWAKTDFIRPLTQFMTDRAIKIINKMFKVDSMLFTNVANRKDVQWVIELNDVFPDGRARNITSGWLSARHRPYDPNEPGWVEEHYVDPDYVPFDPFYSRPDKFPKPIIENDLYQYVVEIWPTCNIFKAGHRIRISISTSDFPHLLPVLKPSNNTIVIDEDHIAKVQFTTTNDKDAGDTWKWIHDIDEYLLNHEN